MAEQVIGHQTKVITHPHELVPGDETKVKHNMGSNVVAGLQPGQTGVVDPNDPALGVDGVPANKVPANDENDARKVSNLDPKKEGP